MISLTNCSRLPARNAVAARFMSSLPIRSRGPLVGIVGSGPSAFYTAYRLLQKNPDTRIDMYERRPVPFGLVRYGVAPDHPEVKNVQNKFAEVANYPHFRFVGNVHVGKDVKLKTLAQNYDCLVLAYGASGDRVLGIPGEDLSGVLSARQIVGWYNGLPECQDVNLAMDKVRDVVIVGQGNVSLDVARMLMTPPDKLAHTDASPRFLDAMRNSTIKRITLVGRRSIEHLPCTLKELRELFAIENAAYNPFTIHPVDWDKVMKQKFDRARKRLLTFLYSKQETKSEETAGAIVWGFENELTPAQVLGDGNRAASSIRFHDNRPSSQQDKAFHELPAQLIIRSIGYKSEPLDGLETVGTHFDLKKNVIRNENGRAAAGIYTSGWLKNGPIGVIAVTMMDAFGTADKILKDWETGTSFLENSGRGWQAIEHELQHPYVTWDDWKKIELHEKTGGQRRGSHSAKFLSWEDALKAIGKLE
ncbi:NADPH-adrenodoxin reductase Arh1 [Schizosaccharomyces japonicus yFS275]|uniref:NADPH:adrenodoxin oxidoreductase, mitochondrial n=1 Tax=Schizosaccharomyces japonicus (strain yFS275 / FY16936) TaxID=402676 RepID=B6JXD5_SCHJY|nr:NADPH-adrenodoxin reductase Arh1 [Schizosaccharomyces japonicus yFS275]EEB06036.2 NADPH-adrenodoxin reductase Arh1 [Schizosaccharomyces japonicus yFS275]